MIYYNGTKKVDKVNYLCFKNDLGKTVDIPVDDTVMRLMQMYLDKLQPPMPKTVERGNDEDSL